jgi:predicted permease
MRALSLDSIPGTFIASLRSIGTAMTMASVGYYLHQTDSIGSEGKRALALLSQQITVPLFLFTKIIFCNQDWSDKPCPDVTQSIADVWMLLFWPIYVVGVGLLIGLIVAKATNTPKHHVRSVLAACAFGNSTGLPITLLNVIHSNFPSTSDLGRIDPTLFLSVFLLLYPILLWGLGGWLLAPDEENSVNTAPPPVIQNDQVASSQMNGKNSTETSFLVTGAFLNGVRRRRLSGADEGHYLSEQ